MTIEPGAGESGRLDLDVQGVFDEEEARHLTDVLSRVAPWKRVRVHFHHVRHFQGHVVAMLARELSASYGPNIEYVGLSPHDRKVLNDLAPRAPRK